MKNRKRKNTIMVLLILVLGITIGFAALATTLKINGTASITKQTWSVYWGEPTVKEGSVSTTAPTRGADSGDPANTKLTWNVTLNMPGDFYEFEVDAVNAGTIDAMITSITPTVTPALPTNPEYIKYIIKYADGTTPAVNHLLAKNTTERYKVRVYYDKNAATVDTINNMTADATYTFNLELTYSQATDDAVELRYPCPGPECVYAYYTDQKTYIGDNRSTLTGYTNDYTTLLDGNNEQRQVFLGHILDSNDKIKRGFACSLVGGDVSCMEGTNTNKKYDMNRTVALIYNYYNPEQGYVRIGCNEMDTSCIGSGCPPSYTYTECTLDNYEAEFTSLGNVFTKYGSNKCSVNDSGTMSCN